MNLKLRTTDIIFKIANKKADIERVHEVVNKVYRQAGYIIEDMFPDKYSEFSTIFYAINNKTLFSPPEMYYAWAVIDK